MERSAILESVPKGNAVKYFVADLGRDWGAWAISAHNFPRSGDLSYLEIANENPSRRCPKGLTGVFQSKPSAPPGWRHAPHWAIESRPLGASFSTPLTDSTGKSAHPTKLFLDRFLVGIVIACLAIGCADRAVPVAPGAGSPQPAASVESEVKRPAKPAGRLPQFTDIAAQSGIHFQRYDDQRGQHRLLEANGGGVALLDYDGDGRLDIFFTDGCRLPDTDGEDHEHRCLLYRNTPADGPLKFTDTTFAAQLAAPGFFQGCTAGDFDEDGFDDLYVTAFGRHLLWRNQGDGTFAETGAAAGIDVQEWGSSAAFCDLNRDGILDLYVVNYVHERIDPPTLCPRADAPDGYVQCPPAMFPGAQDRLFLGDGAGGFRDVTREAGIVAPDGKGLGVVVWDMNRDGWPDIFVANDGVPNFLFIQKPPDEGPAQTPRIPVFQEQAVALGAALSAEGRAAAGMGVAAGDYDGDGWLDLVITTFFGEPSMVLHNQGQGQGAVAGVPPTGGRINQEWTGFSDEAGATGIGPATRKTLGFGVEFVDFDNDGWLDLFIANGHVDDLRWHGPEQYRMPAQFFRNERNGRFTEVSEWSGPYFGELRLGRGVAAGDLDGDGDQDLVISNQLDAAALLRNDAPTDFGSVSLKLVGRTTSSRSAFGARVEAINANGTQVREVVGGGSFQSASDREVHLGLGTASSFAVVRVRWPSGEADEWHDVPGGRYIARERGALIVLRKE